MVCKDIDAVAKNDFQKKYFKDILAAATEINNLSTLDSFVYSIYVLLNSQFSDFKMKEAECSMKMICSKKRTWSENLNDIDNEKMLDDIVNEERSIQKSSPFYKRFSASVQNIILNEFAGQTENIFFNKELWALIIGKYHSVLFVRKCIESE